MFTSLVVRSVPFGEKGNLELSMALPMAYLPLHTLTMGDGLRFFSCSHVAYSECQLQVFIKYLYHGIVMICIPIYFPQGPLVSLMKSLCLSHLQSQDKAQCLAYRKHLKLQSKKSNWIKYFPVKYLWGFVKKKQDGNIYPEFTRWLIFYIGTLKDQHIFFWSF